MQACFGSFCFEKAYIFQFLSVFFTSSAILSLPNPALAIVWRASRLANTKGTSGLVLRTRPSASMVSRQPISRALGERRRTKFQTQDLQQNQQLPPPVAKLAHLNMPRTYAFSSDSLLRRKCIELRNILLCNLLYHQLRIWPHHNPHLYLDST